MVLLSTDSPEDLTKYDKPLISFSTELPALAEALQLAYPYKWFVGSRDGCSCGFRHLYIGSVELGFGEPEEWFPEEAGDIQATVCFVKVVSNLLANGASVDCIDAWGHESSEADLSGTVDVNLNIISELKFRFFENHRFVFTASNIG
ncbi:MAG: hypothetical protein IPN42_04665 [Methylococcaceae bacterium]|nr:hypothetical protein [Methylococcaceae bacterium]